jgi:hypothetical protein
MDDPGMEGRGLEGTAADGGMLHAECDSEAARLLPWHVTGRLAAGDAARVTQHLAQCATCRADFESQRVLRERLRDDGPLEYAPQAGLAATLARIDEMGRELAVPVDAVTSPAAASTGATGGDARAAAVRGPVRWRAPQWLAAAVVVQAIGLGVLGALLFARDGARSPVQPTQFETLSTQSPEAPGGQLRAVFAADMTLGQLEQLLGARGLQVVSGPTEAGVYTLGLGQASPAAIGTALRALRADPRVRFAEPTAGTQVSP